MTITLLRKALVVGAAAALVGGCAAKYPMRDDGWGYEGTVERGGMRVIAVYESQSLCTTRLSLAHEAQRQGGTPATLSQCQPMAVVTPGSPGTTETYWGFGMPSEGTYVLLSDSLTCDTFHSASVLPVWKKTTCGLVGLKRGR